MCRVSGSAQGNEALQQKLRRMLFSNGLPEGPRKITDYLSSCTQHTVQKLTRIVHWKKQNTERERVLWSLGEAGEWMNICHAGGSYWYKRIHELYKSLLACLGLLCGCPCD